MAGRRGKASSRLGALFGFHPVPEPDLLSGGTPSADSLRRDTIRVLTWNVHKHADPAWHRDFDRILDEHRPDIVQLQEARIDSMLAAFSTRPETWSWMASPNLSMPASGVAVGAFTAARAPLRQGVARLSAAAEPLLKTRKPMLSCSLEVLGSPSPLLCLNIHAVNFSLGLRGFRHQLDALLGDAGVHAGPVIFSGDFNTWSRWRMDLLLERMDAVGLRRVAFEAEGPLPRWLSVKSLDHVFHSHGEFTLRPATARKLGSVRSSDHAPLLVDFVP